MNRALENCDGIDRDKRGLLWACESFQANRKIHGSLLWRVVAWTRSYWMTRSWSGNVKICQGRNGKREDTETKHLQVTGEVFTHHWIIRRSSAPPLYTAAGPCDHFWPVGCEQKCCMLLPGSSIEELLWASQLFFPFLQPQGPPAEVKVAWITKSPQGGQLPWRVSPHAWVWVKPLRCWS